MKMNTKAILTSLSILAAFACSRESVPTDNQQEGNEPQEEITEPAGGPVTITASVPDALTKVAFTPDSDPDGGITLSWEATDNLRIISGSSNELFSIENIEGSKATFSGNAVSGTSFDILYPGSYATVAEAETAVADYSVQTQAGNNSPAHLSYAALLSGVDDYHDIRFSSDWAAAHGGTLKQRGVLRVRLQLPEDVSTVTDALVEFGPKSIAVNFSGGADVSADHILTFYANLPWEELSFSAGDELTVTAVTSDHDVYHKTVAPGASFQMGKVNAVKLSRTDIVLDDFAGGSGVSGDPWLIGNARQMQKISANLAAGETKYFKLIENIDLVGVEWVPLNNASPYTCGIDFDGDDKTISNLKNKSGADCPALFGVLVGGARNLTIDGAEIIAGSKRGGIFCNYLGHSTAGAAVVSGITIKNSSVTGTGSSTGAIAAIMQNASSSISGSKVDGTTVSGKEYVGGLVGSVENGQISDCHIVNSSSVTGTEDRIGGAVGQAAQAANISKCSAENVTVSGNVNVGGFIGVCYCNVTESSSSGTVSTINSTAGKEVNVGGFAGYLQYNKLLKCSSSATINTKYRNLGGLVGKIAGNNCSIEKCWASGTVTSSNSDRHVGGLVGNVAGASTITDSYATGAVTGGNYVGGLAGYVSAASSISACYAKGDVSGTSGASGGLIGYAGVAGSTVSKCVAWNDKVTGATASNSWSSAAVVGATFPKCTLTDNYRNPAMNLTAWWNLSAEGMNSFQHQNVSSSSPLIVKLISDGTLRATTATSMDAGQDNRPQFAYHGKVDASKTLSQLCADVLGWSADIWDFTTDFPTLK